jgi:hypothetical protein
VGLGDRLAGLVKIVHADTAAAAARSAAGG